MSFKPLRITCVQDMVNIDSKDIAFGHIPNVCKNGDAMVSLQASEHINRKAGYKMCIKISEAIEEFNDEHIPRKN